MVYEKPGPLALLSLTWEQDKLAEKQVGLVEHKIGPHLINHCYTTNSFRICDVEQPERLRKKCCSGIERTPHIGNLKLVSHKAVLMMFPSLLGENVLHVRDADTQNKIYHALELQFGKRYPWYEQRSVCFTGSF